jgi:hypothetical protein
MRRIQVQKAPRTAGSRLASLVTQSGPMDCRDLDVVRAKQLQRERKRSYPAAVPAV